MKRVFVTGLLLAVVFMMAGAGFAGLNDGLVAYSNSLDIEYSDNNTVNSLQRICNLPAGSVENGDILPGKTITVTKPGTEMLVVFNTEH